ncbi:hypothetical protein AAHC03_017111 [Spirometra sp. Aus1]
MKRLILLFLLRFISCTVPGNQDFASCTNDNEKIICWSIPGVKLPFNSALAECQKKNLDLVTILSSQSQKAVADSVAKHAKGASENYWIGLHWSHTMLQWVSGYPAVPFTSWKNPSQRLSSECISMLSGDAGLWEPRNCNERHYFVCGNVTTNRKKPADPFLPLLQTLVCPEGYFLLNRRCLAFFLRQEDAKPWSEAKQACTALNSSGHLVTISSMQLQDHITALAANQAIPAWIGLQGVGQEHQWVNGAPVTFTNWMASEPNGGNEAQCVSMQIRASVLGQWSDEACTKKRGYICETNPEPREVDPSAHPLDFLFSRGRCAPGFYEYHSICVALLPAAELSRLSSPLHDEVTDLCQQSTGANCSGHLGTSDCPIVMTPHTIGDAAFQRSLIRKFGRRQEAAWVGLKVNYHGVYFDAPDFLESTRLMNFSVRSILAQDAKLTLCGSLNINSELLQFIPCDQPHRALCGYFLDEHSYHSSKSESGSSTAECPPNWQKHESSCYRFFPDGALSWTEADLACRTTAQRPAHLVSVKNADEETFVRSLGQDRPFWIGLSASVGSHDSSGSTLRWSDNSHVAYFPLAADQSSEVECAQISPASTDWLLAKCDSPAPYMCKMPLDASSSHTDLGECMTTDSNYCATINFTPLSFDQAQLTCGEKKLSLATIVSESQQAFVTEQVGQIAEDVGSRFWIGLYSSFGSLHWISGYPAVPVAFWQTGSEGQVKSCIYISQGDNYLNWGTAPCSDAYPSICTTNLTIPPDAPDRHQFQCPEGFTAVGKKCLKVISDVYKMRTFEQSIAECRIMGASLAVINCSFEQDAITAMMSSQPLPVWIGLRMQNHQHVWVQNVPIIYTNWVDNEPLWHNKDLCTQVSNRQPDLGRWSEVNCSTTLGYICEKAATTVPAGAISNSGLLQSGPCTDPNFAHFGDACYSLLSQQLSRQASSLTDGVSAACNSLHSGAVPAVPHSAGDAAFMRYLAAANYSSSITATDPATFWIGLKLNTTDLSLHSEDQIEVGSPVYIDYAALFEEIAANTGENICFALVSGKPVYEAKPCNDTAPVICSYFLESHSSKPPADTTQKCPSGLLPHGKFCYALPHDSRKANWQKAEEACKRLVEVGSLADIFNHSFEAHLASIHDPATANFLVDTSDVPKFWIGLSSHHYSRFLFSTWPRAPFTWTDGSPINYFSFARQHWSSSEQLAGSCITMDSQTHEWIATPCGSQLPYACQFPREAFILRQDDIEDTAKCPKALPLTANASGACYAIIDKPRTFSEAAEFCHSLHPRAHIASFHYSDTEKDLLPLLSVNHSYWFGLYKVSNIYLWVDSNSVDHVQKSTGFVRSRGWRLRDCFKMSLTPNGSLWMSENCSTELPFICQAYVWGRAPTSSTAITSPSSASYALLSCPPRYRQHEDRCFKVLPQTATFEEAERQCIDEVAKQPHFAGSLVRIANERDQDFVSALFAAVAPADGSTAWIGLRSDSVQWTDYHDITFLHSSLGDLNDQQADNQTDMCMGLLYSVDPHLNGLWVRMPCSLRGHVQAICQASPTRFAATGVPAASPPNSQTDLFTCPVGFKLGLFNTTSAFNAETGGRGSVSRLPACHRLASEKPMTRENAQKLCESLSAHLPSIESVSDLNYFRAWLQSPLSLGGAGLTPTDAVWLGLQVPGCPDCWRAWSWDSVGQSAAHRPVRITDWYEAPSDPSGCYVFNVSSHHPHDVNFESMQPAKCDSAFPVVCQTVASPALSTPSSSPTAESVLIEHRLADPPSCAASANGYVRTDIHVAMSGNACVRWDLVNNFVENVKQPALESDVSSVFGAHFSWFGGNSCAYVVAPFGNDSLDAGNTSTPQFVCFTSRDHTSLEACQVVTCVPEEYGLSGTSSLGLIVGFFLLSLLFLTLMGLLIYRFGYRSYNRGYRRQRPVPFTLSGNLPGGESVFGLPTYRRSFFHSLAPVRIFDASNASMLTPAPSAATTFKNPLYRPLFDASLEEPDNVEEFSSPHV